MNACRDCASLGAVATKSLAEDQASLQTTLPNMRTLANGDFDDRLEDVVKNHTTVHQAKLAGDVAEELDLFTIPGRVLLAGLHKEHLVQMGEEYAALANERMNKDYGYTAKCRTEEHNHVVVYLEKEVFQTGKRKRVEVTLPDGVGPGTRLVIPYDGKKFSFVVPDDAKAKTNIIVNLPEAESSAGTA